ncbi:glycosyltransferase [Pseudoalteromonas issachenkonii]|uniref:glycosyltransferase n=1 Tax=Pseudoalteromonas issachenkonii TaxID=152297 RepID=UPI000C4784F9|nr:glycosyltransferase [Pseudoalteromonas issachenkonii]MAY60558.1 glycosyl transferase [Pseudoalteromonas sp.]|tara:strand:+ start:2456 stop:3568 length:1113 start_codon:yes stop_codon:yes gene_type:complete
MDKIAHLTSAHPRFDTRIFWKQCRSLSKEGYEVYLIVADGKGNEVNQNVNILDVGKANSRFNRITQTPKKILSAALKLNAVIYHLHDPELIPIGLKLKKLGKKVIFDAHEDFPKQILSKPYLNFFIRKFLSQVAAIYETYACRKLDAVVSATPFICDKFTKQKIYSVDINNYPLLNELFIPNYDWQNKKSQVCYVGGLNAARGISEIVSSVGYYNTGLKLAIGGKFTEVNFESYVKSHKSWSHVIDKEWLDRDGIKEVLNESIAGLVTLHPIINYLDSLPVKMFEYMACGLPVIASNFPLWQEIIESNECGVCVDPLDPKSIANAVNHIADNPDIAEAMGRNGRKAVIEKYNWDIEVIKLSSIYSKIISS